VKKISKWYYILMVLFIISAVSDFYSYSLFMNGKSSIIYIQGASMVQSAVDMHLILAIVKLVLAGLAILVGWRETKNKKRSRSMTAVTVALTVSIIGIWIISMNYLTTVTAQGISNALYDKGLGYASDVGQSASLREFCEGSEKQPDQLEHRMLQAIDEHTFSTYLSTGQKNWEKAHFRIRDTAYPVERAVLFYDGSGKLLHSSGEDVMYFPYYTQDQWEAGIRRTSRPSYSWIDISGGKNSENGQEDMYSRFRNGFAGTGEMGIAALRITGYFEGTQLVPVVMDYLTDSAAKHMAVGSGLAGPTGIIDAHILCSLDKSNSLEWQPQFDRAGEYKAKDLVTVYAYYPDMWDYAGESLTYGGQYYEDLVSLTERLDLPLKNSDTCRKSSIGGTKELTVFSMEAYKQAESETADFYLVTAIRGKPLAYAAEELLHVYVYTGLLALGFLLAARYGIKKHLAEGTDVVCDRYYYSSLAYQGVDGAMEWVAAMNLECPVITKPDICLFLDMDPEKCHEHIRAGRTHFEIYEENAAMISETRRRYGIVFEMLKDRDNIAVIDSTGSIEEVFEQIKTEIDKLL